MAPYIERLSSQDMPNLHTQADYCLEIHLGLTIVSQIFKNILKHFDIGNIGKIRNSHQN